MIRRLAREEDGWALVTAVLVAVTMVFLGLGVFAFVDGQQRASRGQRERDSAFNLADGALTQQLYLLSQKWPSSLGQYDYSSPCSNTQAGALCPTQVSVGKTFNSVDYASASSWKIVVKDNPAPYDRFWSDALLTDPAVPAYDKSADDRVWVRAQGTARGRTRALVALVKVELLPVRFPRTPFMAGAITFGNNAPKKTFVDATGSSAQYVRNGMTCSGVAQQIQPCNLQAAQSTSAIAPGALEALRQTAKAQGTYWADCSAASGPGPTNNPPASARTAVYFVESGSCGFAGNSTWNSAVKPGLFIVASGTVKFTGVGKFYGVIYAANQQNSTGTVVDLGGNSSVYGGVMVDGSGQLNTTGAAQMSGDSAIEYRDVSLSDINAYGTAGIIQNTWRELPTH